MKAPLFGYNRPSSVDEAVALLATLENARVLAGGQSLMAMLNMRFAFPDCLVDINRLSELAYIRDDGDCVQIGALTRQREVEYSELVAQRLPLWREAILNVGHRQTRNRGTIGGSLCQLDPSAEIPTVALAMDAVLHARSVRGTRSIGIDAFPAAYMTPALEPDELLVGLSIPVWPAAAGHAFIEFSRRHGDFAIASAAVMVLCDPDGVITRISLTLGGVASAALRMTEAETYLLGTTGTETELDEAARMCSRIDASSDSYVPGWYRQRLAGVLSKRALGLALRRARAAHSTEIAP